MNVSHPDLKKINPKIVKPLLTITNKMLEKDRNKRYLRAIHVATHLRELGKRIDAVATKKKAQGIA
jgi:serine/threonine-protein kinase